MFKKFMAFCLSLLPLCASAGDIAFAKAKFDFAPVAWRMDDVAQADRSHYQKQILTWQTGGGQAMVDTHYFAQEPVLTQQDIISSEIGVNELGFLSSIIKITPQAAVRLEAATKQALKTGGAHISIVDDSLTKVYGTLNLFEPLTGEEFELHSNLLALSTHQNLQFVLSDYAARDGYTLKNITRIPPPESIQHPVYFAKQWGVNQDDIEQLAIINQGDIYGIGSDAYVLVATLKPSAITKKEALMYDNSVGLMIHHPHESIWYDYAPSYEDQLTLPDNQIAIAISLEPSTLASLFE